MVRALSAFNARVNASAFGRFFKLEERGSNFTTELKGATATFMTMAYILVRRDILDQTSCFSEVIVTHLICHDTLGCESCHYCRLWRYMLS